jgi:hypothetical protein
MKTPLHLWIVGIVSLLWNLVGGADFVMTVSGNQAYLSNFTPEQLEYFASYPAWSILSWGLGTLGSVAGSLLLLLRSRHAVTAFALSLIGIAVTSLYSYVLSPISMSDLVGPGTAIFSLLIAAIAVALLVYALRLRASGLLR